MKSTVGNKSNVTRNTNIHSGSPSRIMSGTKAMGSPRRGKEAPITFWPR